MITGAMALGMVVWLRVIPEVLALRSSAVVVPPADPPSTGATRAAAMVPRLETELIPPDLSTTAAAEPRAPVSWAVMLEVLVRLLTVAPLSISSAVVLDAAAEVTPAVMVPPL